MFKILAKRARCIPILLVLPGSCLCLPRLSAQFVPTPGRAVQDEHSQMVKRLHKLALQGDPMDHYHWNARRAKSLKTTLTTLSGKEKLQTWYFYCLETLYSGDPKGCIKELEHYLDGFGKPLAELLSKPNLPVFELLALAYLRLGEDENCQASHSPESCILPLREGGLHQLTTGSQKAMELYALILNKFPDPKYGWLYNLAAMTLDKHPEGVIKHFSLTFPNWEKEQQDFPRFEEVAMNVGLAANGLVGGTCVDDFNNDGLLDVFVTSHGVLDPVRLFLNDGKGGFEDATAVAGLTGIVSGFNCIQADYDNDGWTDILVLRGAWLHNSGIHPNSLLKNMGDGTFRDRTRSAGLLSFHPTQTAGWSDFDRDGDLDLFIGNEGGPDEPHNCELFVNQGDGTFKEAAATYGLGSIREYVKGCAWGDVDNNGWPDLYISVLGGNNLLYCNFGGTFMEMGSKTNVQEPYYSFPCWMWDVNNDGNLDIFASGYDLKDLNGVAREYARELLDHASPAEQPRLYINEGKARFKNRTTTYGLDKVMYSMGSNFGDLDNDGWLDFYIGTGAPDFSTVVPNRMFHNLGGERFEEVTSAGNFGHIQKGHGVAFADLDQDGDQDIYAVMGGAYEGDQFTNILYENPISHNNWIVIQLEGVASNRSAIGCRIDVHLSGGRTLYRTVGTGGSFGASSLQQEIGLGSETIEKLVVHWTNGAPQEFRKVPVNTKILITEGEKKHKTLKYKPVPFRSKPDHHKHQH